MWILSGDTITNREDPSTQLKPSEARMEMLDLSIPKTQHTLYDFYGPLRLLLVRL